MRACRSLSLSLFLRCPTIRLLQHRCHKCRSIFPYSDRGVLPLSGVQLKSISKSSFGFGASVQTWASLEVGRSATCLGGRTSSVAWKQTDSTHRNHRLLRTSLPCFLTLFSAKHIGINGDPPATGAEGAGGAADGATTGPTKLSASQVPPPLKSNAQNRMRRHQPWESQASAVEGKHIRWWLGRCLLADSHALSPFESYTLFSLGACVLPTPFKAATSVCRFKPSDHTRLAICSPMANEPSKNCAQSIVSIVDTRSAT